MVLQSWPVKSDMFIGTDTAGPVPIVFADWPGHTTAALVAEPNSAHADLQRIMMSLARTKVIRHAELVNWESEEEMVETFPFVRPPYVDFWANNWTDSGECNSCWMSRMEPYVI